MKEDILEQLVDDYLQTRGYFTKHNIKFKPSKNHQDYSPLADANHSDIDVIGFNPKKEGVEQVFVVSCKSWQSGFRVKAKLEEIEKVKIISGREAWKAFRELCQPKWSEAFCEVVYDVTGSRNFTYITAVTKLIGSRELWENYGAFRDAIHGNPIKILTIEEMLNEITLDLTTTVASSDFGRTIQLLKTADLLKESTKTGLH
jgi:hypothetical protein